MLIFFSRVSQTVSVSVETKMKWNLFCDDKDATLLARFIQLCVHIIQCNTVETKMYRLRGLHCGTVRNISSLALYK